MASVWRTWVRGTVLLGLALSLTRCLAATAAAAGAGTGIYLTSRGAESIVEGPVDELEKRARAVFAAEGIPVSGSQMENSGDKREIKGTKGELQVTVAIERQAPQARQGGVSAREHPATW